MRVRFIHWRLLFVIAVTSFAVSFGQPKNGETLNDARQRSQDAEEIISSLSPLVPKNIRAVAVGIGAFRCKKTDLLLEHAIICRGVISSRVANGWGPPAFFRIFAGGGGRPERPLSDADQVVLIFTANPPVDWLTLLKQAQHAEAGPLENSPTVEQEFFSKSHVFAYIRRKQEWRGDQWNSGFWKSTGVAEDNDINKRLYGSNGHDALALKAKTSAQLPAEILALQKYLTKNWSAAM
jgi:hypothetical protein